jgi:peptide/nickel transport system permease protein
MQCWQSRIALPVLAVIVLAALFAPLMSAYPPNETDFQAIMKVPSSEHWFGTDEVGRDIFSRVLHGARTSLSVVAVSLTIGAMTGIVIGLVAGWVGGAVDVILMRMMDALLAFPLLVLALAIIAVLGPDLTNAILTIAIVKVPAFARVTRGELLILRDLDYITAMRAMGASTGRILLKHILPNASGPVIIYFSLAASQALMTDAALSFLGLGVQPPTSSWGGMVSIGMQNWNAWWMSVFPGLAIGLTVLSLNLLGDALRDALDQRLR